MTQYQGTVDEATVHQVLQRDEGLAELVSIVLHQILDAQVTEQLQAKRYECTEGRQGYRNEIRPGG